MRCTELVTLEIATLDVVTNGLFRHLQDVGTLFDC